MRISAPGKLMLFGEHAAVYGKPCIVTAIDSRLYVSRGTATGDTRFLDAAIAAWGKPGITLTAESAFSGAFGFGSSSAVTVAALKYLRPDANEREIFDVAKKIILSVQGKGSGFDAAAATYGGTLYFKDGGKVIEKLSAPAMPLIVGYTGTKADTVKLIGDVEEKMKRQPERVNRIFDAIEKITNEAKAEIAEGDWQRVGTLMNFNQEYLRDLGVSSGMLERLISAAVGAGAWGAKLSGAGGGDCMIALSDEKHRKSVEDAISAAGGQVIHIKPHARGVRVESSDDEKELFIVVDPNDNIVTFKSRYECHHDKTLIHRTAGVLVFDDKGRLLLQKRSATKDIDPGLWDISSAGHVTRGQEYEEAARRELKEELGIEARLVPVTKHIMETSVETEMSMLYKTLYNGPFNINPEEVERVEFFDPRELRLAIASKKITLTEWAKLTLPIAGIPI